MKFKRNDKRKIRAAVEMTPLIDVVFQLLIFFMLSSTFVVQTSIPIETPLAEGAEKLALQSPYENIVIIAQAPAQPTDGDDLPGLGVPFLAHCVQEALF